MGEARRRKAGDAARQAWADGVDAFAEESGGMTDLWIVRPPDLSVMLDATLAGDPKAAQLAKMVIGMTGRVRASAGLPDPPLCGSCDSELGRVPYSVVIAAPDRDDPTNALVFGVCVRCAKERKEIAQKSATALRRLFPEVRLVEMQGHEAGSA